MAGCVKQHLIVIKHIGTELCFSSENGGSRYLLKSIRCKVIHALLLCGVPHPEMVSPHPDLCLIQPSLPLNPLHIHCQKAELGCAGEHGALQAGDAGLGESGHFQGRTSDAQVRLGYASMA